RAARRLTKSQDTIQATVTLTTTGARTETSTARFHASTPVTVVNGAIAQINSLINLVNSLNLSPSNKQAFNAKLLAAIDFINLGDIRNACIKLQDFINLARAQTGKGLTSKQANQLIQKATAIRASLGCS